MNRREKMIFAVWAVSVFVISITIGVMISILAQIAFMPVIWMSAYWLGKNVHKL